MSVFGAPVTDLASVPVRVNGQEIVSPPPVNVSVPALVAVKAPPGLMLTVAAVAAPLVIAASDAATTAVSSSVRRVRIERPFQMVAQGDVVNSRRRSDGATRAGSDPLSVDRCCFRRRGDVGVVPRAGTWPTSKRESQVRR